VFYDTEFIDDGKTIDLISLGAVDNRGREFYAVSTEFNVAMANDFVKVNVLPLLPPRSDPAWKTRREIRDAYLAWLTAPGDDIQQWAYFGAYDHIAVCQLWGPMIAMPEKLPWYTNELMQLWNLAGRPTKPPKPGNQHDALADAHWNRQFHDVCWSRMGILHGPPGASGIIRPGHGTGPRLEGEPGPETVHLPAGTTVHHNEETRDGLR
jgi:hypothetical protein